MAKRKPEARVKRKGNLLLWLHRLTGNVHQLRDLLQRYFEQRQAAKQRGVEWQIDFWEWLRIWQDSGHLHERGGHRGSYQMYRFEDIGPYASSNVRIDLMENNIREAKARQKVAGATKTFPDCPESHVPPS